MSNEILDFEVEETKNKNYKQIFIDSLPILILFAIVLYSLYEFATTDNVFTIAKIIGTSGVILATLLYFAFDRQIGISIFISVLFLSIFGIVKFTPIYQTFSIFGLTFPPLPTLLFFVSLYWYREPLKKVIEKIKQVRFIKKMLDYWNSLPE